jgi:Ca2+-binding RTX toxin-like protein
MAIRTVGPNSDFPTIAAAMQASGPGDTIQLEAGYSNETATIAFSGMTITGGAGSTGIVLNLAMGIATVTMTGTAPFELNDASDGNGIVGNAGDNRISVTGGVDAVDGGLGEDRLIVDYREATGAVTGDSTSNFTEAGGGGRMVTMTEGTIEHYKVMTGSGADTITTGDGDDIIKTGSGASTVSAGQGANIINGGGDADTITALDGGNIVKAGNGTNTVTTGAGADEISAGTGADTIVSGGGDDRIFLFGGADSVDTGGGDDRLIIDYSAMTTDVTGGITGGNGNTGYVGHIADLLASSIDFEGSESFYISTGSGDDTLTTGKGDDMLRGSGGLDVFDAGQGDDQVSGGGGGDELRGGRGADVVTGGGGADVFVFASVKEADASSGRDLIRDVEAGVDRIDLRGMDADTDASGNQAFVFIGAAKFTSEAGELRYAKGVVSGDVDGDGRADFAIEIGNDADLRAGDFQL